MSCSHEDEYQKCSVLRCNAGSCRQYFRGEYCSVFSVEVSQVEKVASYTGGKKWVMEDGSGQAKQGGEMRVGLTSQWGTLVLLLDGKYG
jgi:hypothetical protein